MAGQTSEKNKPEKIRCDACPVMCYIADGRTGACDRYSNEGGQLVRMETHVVLEAQIERGEEVVEFIDNGSSAKAIQWNGAIVTTDDKFVTAIGAGTTYPDYKPAPFIVASKIDNIDMITVVTEGIFSYCGAKIKVDTDRHLGPERNLVRVNGEPIGHVTTGEYGSQMLSLGGVHHLTGGEKKEGRITCSSLLALCNGEAVTMNIDEGVEITVEAGKAPIINGVEEARMRVGCGSATVGMFASQWQGLVDEVVVVDDHITGVISEHQAGKVLDWPASGIKILGRRSTPGRYFKVAEPGMGWGGTNLDDPLKILGDFNPKIAKAGQSLLMVSTTGEQFAYYELDEDLKPVKQPMPERLIPSVERIEENCEPAMCSVLFMGGAGGSLRAGVTENPVRLTRSVKSALTHITCGGAPAYVWPGGGITIMSDVVQMPKNAFGYVPTPALVAPIEFTMRREDYEALGGHMGHVVSLDEALQGKTGKQNDHILKDQRQEKSDNLMDWPMQRKNYAWASGALATNKDEG